MPILGGCAFGAKCLTFWPLLCSKNKRRKSLPVFMPSDSCLNESRAVEHLHASRSNCVWNRARRALEFAERTKPAAAFLCVVLATERVASVILKQLPPPRGHKCGGVATFIIAALLISAAVWSSTPKRDGTSTTLPPRSGAKTPHRRASPWCVGIHRLPGVAQRQGVRAPAVLLWRLVELPRSWPPCLSICVHILRLTWMESER